MTCTENFVKFRLWFFEISDRTDRQTNRHTRSSQYFAHYRRAK